jgi:hypothetical protein
MIDDAEPHGRCAPPSPPVDSSATVPYCKESSLRDAIALNARPGWRGRRQGSGCGQPVWAISGPLSTANAGYPRCLTCTLRRLKRAFLALLPRPSKLAMRVRFSSPALSDVPSQGSFRHAAMRLQKSALGPATTWAISFWAIDRPSEPQLFPLCTGHDVRPLTAGLHDVRHCIFAPPPARLSSSSTVP